ncbi:MAG: DUF599 domain-containing protein [Roseicyclus sp.]|jgi:uncharacterized membrane protein|nr:DUF599 domain-containing protein [Roseicyclus sp.]MBO6624344.1 DUF599 domain-containing protein [Roseicyclus sp.]MBO6921592.1 DUF599 domain-containing protein [Roseicyclus sp.]
MNFIMVLTTLSWLDALALATILLAWGGLGAWIEAENVARPSVTVLMTHYRRAWMEEMINRDGRVFDATILTNLRQGTAFFASGAMLATGGLLTLIGNSDQLIVVARDLTLEEETALIWQIKLLLTVVLLTQAVLRFVWSNRLFGYCAVLMAAVPNDPTDPRALPRAGKAAEINIRAAFNFNRGMRAIYFALGSLAWLLGPVPLIAAVLVISYVIWNRDFASASREVMLSDGEQL